MLRKDERHSLLGIEIRASAEAAHLIETVRELQERGVHFRSLQEHLDTSTSGGKLVFHVFGALAEFERDLIRERTVAGLVAARFIGQLTMKLADGT